MNNFFVRLFLFFLCFFVSVATMPQLTAIEQNQSIEIVVTDRNSSNKERIINDLLAVQKSLIVSLQNPISEEDAKKGFLIMQMTPEYIDQLLEENQGLIVGAYEGQTLVGYILLTEIAEFTGMYQNKEIGRIETSIDSATLEKMLSLPKVGYIEQIGIKPGCSKRGIGSLLVKTSQKLKPDGLTAVVLLEPVPNEASLQFFSRMGFKKSGILHQYPRENFPDGFRTQIFFWNLFPI